MIEVVDRIECTSTTFVELIEHSNDDEVVKDAARVSHEACAKSASPTLIDYLAKNEHFTPFGHVRLRIEDYEPQSPSHMLEWLCSRRPGWTVESHGFGRGAYTIEGSLYNWLAISHDLPPREARVGEFAFQILRELIERGCRESVVAFTGETIADAVMTIPDRERLAAGRVSRGTWKTFRVHAPVIALRQLMRSNHEIVYNEISRRYVISDPEFFSPDVWRRKPAKAIKQGSGEGEVRTFLTKDINEWISSRGFFPFAIDLTTAYKDWLQTAGELYKLFISAGVAPELARCLLPVSHYSEVWMTMSDAAIERVTSLRSNRGGNNHAQKEIEEVSRAIEMLALRAE